MAEASSSHISKDKLTDDFLSCSLCLESYKQPKVLHCQHTFCLPCLHNLVGVCSPGLVITCPLCREETCVVSGNLSSLKTNFTIESLLSFLSRMGSTEHGADLEWSGQKVAEHCQLCDEKRPSVMFCDDCKVWLCRSCSVPHNKLPATKSHRTLSVADILDKAKDGLKGIEKELQDLYEKIESKHQQELMEQNFVSEQMNLTATQVEASWKRLVTIITEKKNDLMQEIAVTLSDAETKQSLKICQLKESSQKIKSGLDFLKDLHKSTDAYLVTSMMGNVEALRKSVDDVTLSDESPKRKKMSFQPVESLLRFVHSSQLGSIHCAESSVQHAAQYPHDMEIDGELLHRLAYGFYVTGLAPSSNGKMFVASNCNSLKKIGSGLCEADVHNVTKPWGVFRLPSSELVITDCGRNLGCGSVNIFGTDGQFVRMIAMGLSLPRGVAVDSHGRVYVCDESDRCVYVMTSEGRIVHILKHTWDGKFQFEAPRFVTVNSDNQIYVSDAGKFIKIFDDAYQLKRTYTSAFAQSDFWDVVTDDADLVYVADWTHGIHILTASGNFIGFLKQPANHIVITEPTALCYYSPSLMIGTSNGEILSVKAM